MRQQNLGQQAQRPSAKPVTRSEPGDGDGHVQQNPRSTPVQTDGLGERLIQLLGLSYCVSVHSTARYAVFLCFCSIRTSGRLWPVNIDMSATATALVPSLIERAPTIPWHSRKQQQPYGFHGLSRFLTTISSASRVRRLIKDSAPHHVHKSSASRSSHTPRNRGGGRGLSHFKPSPKTVH
jgi:hypothetical protein